MTTNERAGNAMNDGDGRFRALLASVFRRALLPLGLAVALGIIGMILGYVTCEPRFTNKANATFELQGDLYASGIETAVSGVALLRNGSFYEYASSILPYPMQATECARAVLIETPLESSLIRFTVTLSDAERLRELSEAVMIAADHFLSQMPNIRQVIWYPWQNILRDTAPSKLTNGTIFFFLFGAFGFTLGVGTAFILALLDERLHIADESAFSGYGAAVKACLLPRPRNRFLPPRTDGRAMLLAAQIAAAAHSLQAGSSGALPGGKSAPQRRCVSILFIPASEAAAGHRLVNAMEDLVNAFSLSGSAVAVTDLTDGRHLGSQLVAHGASASVVERNTALTSDGAEYRTLLNELRTAYDISVTASPGLTALPSLFSCNIPFDIIVPFVHMHHDSHRDLARFESRLMSLGHRAGCLVFVGDRTSDLARSGY